MFIRRSEYKALLKSKDRWETIAKETIKQNETLLYINEKINKNCGELIKIYESLVDKLEKKYTEEGK